ncbi:MAG TPA: hypothetical protein VGX96_11815 [Candidatus Elarobacter sp.]|jgi:hypothetical protein|nr:hypothetical protein [Candidatus Elarobacter sp.]
MAQAGVGSTAGDLYAPSIRFEPPAKRSLKVYAFDPTMGRTLGNNLIVDVRYEPLKPGPIGERFAVVDYDGSTKSFYAPVNLDDPHLLLRGGLDPTESDPRFHQQMVYAVASETLERFEVALGRRVHWRRPTVRRQHVPNRLYLFPHAMVQANAFYSPDAHGILFGYFRAGNAGDAEVLPGQTVFTCLSHDIVAHEVTHAIVDGIRTYFTEPTNIDVPAFHEAFADLAALFRHFSHREVLLDTLQRTGGKLYTSTMASDAPASDKPVIQSEIAPDNPLIELARQFGQVSGLHSGLRSALGTPPTPQDIQTKTEPHARGAILVAAVFDAYFAVYLRQTADLFRVFRAGGGPADPVDLPGPLAELLAATASRLAETFFAVCARSLDYLPPVDVTFGDFLRALITADLDLFPSDTLSLRDAIMQAFRLRGIVPNDAQFFSEDALCWPRVLPGRLPTVSGLVFGDPNGLTRDEQNVNGGVLRKYAKANAKALGFDASEEIEVPSFHPMFRTDEDGALKIDMIVQMVQSRLVNIDPAEAGLGTFPMRGGVTLMIAQQPLHAGRRGDPEIRYAIAKHLSGDREIRQRAAYAAQGGLGPGEQKINFGLLHGI